MALKLKQNDVTWFQPLWRRVAVTCFLVLWLGWELLFTRDMFWAVLVGAALAYAAYNFFYAFPKEQAHDALPPADPAESEDRQDP
ncbi:hypothetical protein ACFOOL_00055 [Devosia honganensis]|uniref:DUF3329 domain-containing protein n=1 Tax=Devosia honganensis TaxID=1610527 RepID=A0ABV7WVP8_9HYPH